MTDIFIDITVRKADGSAQLRVLGCKPDAYQEAVAASIKVVESGLQIAVGRVRRLPDSRPQPAGRKRRAPEVPA